MKKLLFIALVALSSIGAFAQSRTGSTTIQPKIGLNVSTVGDLDWKAGFVFGAEIQHQFTSKMGLAVDFSILSRAANTTTTRGIQAI